MRWLHAVFPIIGLLRCGRAASRLTEEVSSSPEPQGVPSVGMRRVGYVSGVHGACSKQTALSSRRAEVRRSSPEGVDIGSVILHDGSTPASGTLCLSHGGRKSRRSVDVASASLRCAARRSVPPIASSAGGRTGIIPPLVAGGGEVKGGSGYEQLSVSLSQLPEGLLDFVRRLHAVSTGSGSESPPGWRQYTLGQVMRWGGVLIKP